MSFNLKSVEFLHKKKFATVAEMDFTANSLAWTTILCSDHLEQKLLQKVLTGRYLVKSGKFEIDGADKVNRAWTKKRVKYFGAKNPFASFIPVKTAMFFALLFNRDFYINSKINYITQKYDYLSFSTTKRNATDLEMREHITSLVEKFIQSTYDVERQWVDEFKEQILAFHQQKIKEMYGTTEEHICVMLSDYCQIKETKLNLELTETFLQSLWDKVYSFLDISSSCHCEYNARNSKQKDIRKKVKELNFSQNNYVVRKQLKILEIYINDLKRQIWNKYTALRTLRKQIILEMEKANKGSFRRKFEEIFLWKKLADDQRVEFVKKQEQMFFNNLADEASLVKGKIVEIMHRYHQRVLINALEEMPKAAFEARRTELKAAIVPIRTQAITWTQNIMTSLDMSYDWQNKKNLKVRLNNIYLEILKAHNFEKHNLIFCNTFSTLNRAEANALLNVLQKLKELDSQLTVIFIENDYRNLAALNANGYKFEKGVLFRYSVADDILKNPDEFMETLFYKYNKLLFKYDKPQHIALDKVKVKIALPVTPESTVGLISPFLIKTDKKTVKNEIISYRTRMLSDHFFKDPRMKLTLNKAGQRFFLYDEEPDSVVEEITIPENALIKIV